MGLPFWRLLPFQPYFLPKDLPPQLPPPDDDPPDPAVPVVIPSLRCSAHKLIATPRAWPGLLPQALPRGHSPGGREACGAAGGRRLPGPRGTPAPLQRLGSVREPAPQSRGPSRPRLGPSSGRCGRASAAHWAGRGSSSCSQTGAAQPGRRVCGVGASAWRFIPRCRRSGAEGRRHHHHRRARSRHLS